MCLYNERIKMSFQLNNKQDKIETKKRITADSLTFFVFVLFSTTYIHSFKTHVVCVCEPFTRWVIFAYTIKKKKKKKMTKRKKQPTTRMQKENI